MGKINVGKLIVGSIAAGVVLNAGDYLINNVLMKGAYDTVMAARNVNPAAMNIGTMVVLDFAMALLLVFTYAAIRTRFGAGPKTAIVAGVLVVMIANLQAAYFVGIGFFGWDVWLPSAAMGTANYVIAALVGGALYSE
jgi:hypothetical protein